MRISIILILLASACQYPSNENESVLTTEEEQIAQELIQGSFDKIWGGVDSTEIVYRWVYNHLPPLRRYFVVI